jgi:hypothetical protein
LAGAITCGSAIRFWYKGVRITPPRLISQPGRLRVNLVQDFATQLLILPILATLGMARHPKHNVVEARTSGYITQEKLETFLKERFKVSSLDEFEIKVSPTAIKRHAYKAEIE